ncbi:MAG: dihydroflavonol-4-reductase [Bacteroidota bacterium]|jgi:dihydroflavonol-4-reductase
MKVLVTGSDGLLGNNLIRELLNRNYQVTAFIEAGKSSPTLLNLQITKCSGNLLDAKSVLAAIQGMDIVIHCAANTSMFPARQKMVNEVNISGTDNVISACQQSNVQRLIYVGTANSFGSGNKENLGSEKNSYNSFHYGLDYMDSKYIAQQRVLEKVKNEGLNALVVNPTFMIGPFDSRPTSGEMIRGVYNKKIPGYTLGGKNFVSVKDVAVAITNAITKGKIGECYILGNENLTYKEAFQKIARIVGVEPPKIKMNTPIVKAYGSISSILASFFNKVPKVTRELAILSSEIHFYSSEKAQYDLDMPQTPIEQAINECFEWFIENNYLTKK